MLRTSVWILHQCQNVFQRTFSANIGQTTCATKGVVFNGILWHFVPLALAYYTRVFVPAIILIVENHYASHVTIYV